jgi:hypothetical protein
MLFELVEYVAHRGLHHPFVARHFPFHKRHHRTYHERHDYKGTSWIKSLLQLALSFCGMLCVSGLGTLYVAWAVLVYNAMHCVSHTNIWPTVRAYHRAHHRTPFQNVGVSSPLMDWLCGTMHQDFVVRTPVLLLLPPPLSFAAVRSQ